jgi:hypothetical protein
MKKYSLTYCYTIVTAFSIICCYANEETPLPLVGHLSSIKDETSSATDVVVGKFIRVRESGAASLNGEYYQGQITVLRPLKGNLSGSLEVGFRVIPVNKDKESEPNLSDSYIIIMSSPGDIRKLLPATADNIAKVKALIAAVPASK